MDRQAFNLLNLLNPINPMLIFYLTNGKKSDIIIEGV